MKSNITVGLWCREKQTKEIFSVVKVGENIKIDHSVEDESWLIPENIFRKEFSIVRGLKAQRAEILNDVILQLNFKRYKAVSGDYATLNTKKGDINLCDIYFDGDYTNHEDLKGLQISEFAKKNVKSCSVCAIGSVFMSAVDIHNKLKFDDVDDADYSFIKYLSTWFDSNEMRLMEFVFEGTNVCGSYQPEGYHSVREFREAVISKHHVANPKQSEDFQTTLLREIIANTLKFDTFSPEKGLAREALDALKKVG